MQGLAQAALTVGFELAATVAWTKSEKARRVVASIGNSWGNASIAARSSTARIAHCSRTAALN
jgi:hypothetical protein